MSMMNKTVNLHVGLHKTATTFVQDVLEQNYVEGLKNNVLYIPRKRFRSEVRHLVDKANAQALPELDIAKTRLDALTSSCARVVISEEGILGKYKELIGPHVYPNIDSNLKKWSYIFDGAMVNIYISFRSYADIYRSAFSHAIKKNKSLSGRINADLGLAKADAFKAFASLPIYVVDAVARHFPEATINIWKFEDFVGNELYYINKLASFPIVQRRYIIPKHTRSPSGAAIKKLIAIRAMMLPGFIKRNLSSHVLKKDRGSEPFTLFDEREKRQLDSMFDGDMQDLRKKYPDIVFL
jgi:transposase